MPRINIFLPDNYFAAHGTMLSFRLPEGFAALLHRRINHLGVRQLCNRLPAFKDSAAFCAFASGASALGGTGRLNRFKVDRFMSRRRNFLLRNKHLPAP